MPIAKVQMPDGRIGRFEVPEGTTPDQVLAHVSQQTSHPIAPQQPSGDTSFLNRGIASTLGMPVDLANEAINAPAFNKDPELPALPDDAGVFAKTARALHDAVPPTPNPIGMIGALLRSGGYQGTNTPVGGSASIESAMRSLNPTMVPQPGEKANTFGAQVAEGVGNSAGALVPMGGLMKGLSVMDGVAGNIGKQVLESTAAHPMLATGMDLASGAGSGVGGAVAEDIAPNNPAAKSIGQILGGLAVPGSAAMVVKPTQMAVRAGKSAFFPYTETGGTIRAADRVKSLVPDPEAAANSLDNPTIVPLRPAQMLGDDRTLALENAVRDENVGLDAKFKQNDEANLSTLNSELGKIKGEGNVADTQQLLSSRSDKLSQLLDMRLQQAKDKTDVALEKVAPEMRGSQASIVARKELDSALNDARTQEKQLWNQIPNNILVDKNNTVDTYNQILKATPRAQQEDIPRALMSKVLNAPDESSVRIYNSRGEPMIGDNPPVTERVSELQGLRSKLLEGSRQARADGNFNSARIHDELADAVLNDIGAAPERVQGEVGQKIRDALDFSRQLNERFTRGEVGRVLGTTRNGGDKVAPELTLGSLIGAGKVKGDVGLQSMLEAADTPELRGSVEDYLKEGLTKAAMKDGVVNSSAAKKFMNDNIDILQKFPDLQKSIQNAAESSDQLLAKSARTKQTQKLLVTDSKNDVSKFINAPVGKEFDMIVNSRDPAGFTKDLKNRVAKDPTGAAAKGLKASAVDYVLSKSAKAGAIDGETLLNNLNGNPRMTSALEQILTPEEMQRMRRIGGEMKAVQTTTDRNVGGVIQDAPSNLIATPMRVLSIKAGTWVGRKTDGMTLMTAGIFSSRVKNFITKLTNDKANELITHAVQDPQLYKALLTDMTTKPGAKMAGQRLNAWLLGPGATLLDASEAKKNK